jgi:predicted branched-subunit amino acid permease
MSDKKYVLVEFGWYVLWVVASVLGALVALARLITDIGGY